MKEIVMVKMAEFAVRNSSTVMQCLGLGSCVGVVLYDPVRKLGGLIHVMLPSAVRGKADAKPAKYADHGISATLQEMRQKGAKTSRMHAMIFGGANMFPAVQGQIIGDLGRRNAEAVKAALKQNGIPVRAEQIGGNSGRTIYFDTATGRVRMRKANGVEEVF